VVRWNEAGGGWRWMMVVWWVGYVGDGRKVGEKGYGAGGMKGERGKNVT
jgi:hypothetical protein